MPPASARSTLPVVLFDLDGTLIDSLELLVESMQHAFASREGPSPSVDQWVSSIGRTLRWQFGQYADEGEIESLVHAYRSYQALHHDRLTRLYEGMHDLVVRLDHDGHLVGVVTSKGDELASRSLGHVGLLQYLDIVVGADATSRHKPEPDPIFFALDRLDATPSDAVYVGDSTFDILAANAAGVTSIGVTWGAAPRETLREANASHLVATPAELDSLLAQLRGALTS